MQDLIQKIKTKWSNFKKFPVWKKLILIIPISLSVIILMLLYFLKPKEIINNTNNLIKRNKNLVNKNIKEKQKDDDILAIQDNRVKAKLKDIERRIKENDKQTKTIIDRIDNAIDNPNELECIHSELNKFREESNR